MKAGPYVYLDEKGRPVSLGTIIGKGGEGVVHNVAADDAIAAKIYLRDLATKRQLKVEAMVRAGLHRNTTWIAFPIALLYDSQRKFAGLTMAKVGKRRPAHQLYSPADRRQKFKRADFRFLLRAALNIANAVTAVYANDCVIGDINHSGFLISDEAMVSLIDSDSFQYWDGTETHRCEVGVPEYTPPELQGRNLGSTDRTANHDAFGLAVLIFYLLFMGRHPFVGRFAGGDMPTDKAIAEYRFAYSRDKQRTRMDPPQHVPQLDDLPPTLADAFERAFAPAGASGSRPTAAEWVGLLRAAETQLTPCKRSSTHHYFKSAQSCPWCRMERGFPGFSCFAVAAQINTAVPTQLTQLIAAIRAVPDPGNAPTLLAAMPSVNVVAHQQSFGLSALSRGFLVATAGAMVMAPLGTSGAIEPGLSILGFAGCAFGAYVASAAQATSGKTRSLRQGFDRLARDYSVVSDNRSFVQSRQMAERQISALSALSAEEQQRLNDLTKKLEELQRRRYLERFLISREKIKGLGDARRATLRSYGIETAADIDRRRIEQISGFGPSIASALLAWRRRHESNFVFDPKQPLNPADIAQVKNEIARKRTQGEAALQQHLRDVRQAAADLTSRRLTISQQAMAIWKDLKQAEADDRASPVMVLRAAVFMGCVVVAGFMGLSFRKGPPVLSPPLQTSRPSVEAPPVPVAQSPVTPSASPAATPKRVQPAPSRPPVNKTPAPSVSPSPPPLAPLPSPETPQTAPPVAATDVLPTVTVSPPLNISPQVTDLDVSERLQRLGYLSSAGSGMQQATRDFRAVHGLGASNQIDDAMRETLAHSAVVARGNSFLGGWSGTDGCSQGSQLNVSSAAARSDAGGICRFARITREAGGWKVQARCSAGTKSWTANVMMRVTDGRQLHWNSEKGRAIYYRCE